jgi:hypothetical protein
MSAVRPVVVVAGLGRCGTTLVMHMLAAGGVPCFGKPPGYEDPRVNHRPIPSALFGELEGAAVKVVNPHLSIVPTDAEVIVIWLDREPMQQARSQAKFYSAVGHRPGFDRPQLRRLRRMLLKDRRTARRALAHCEIVEWLDLTFEGLLAQPERCARKMALAIAAHGIPIGSWKKMAAVVDARDAACAPGLDKELDLIARSRRAGDVTAKPGPGT